MAWQVSRNGHLPVLPIYRVVGRVALWWGTFLVATFTASGFALSVSGKIPGNVGGTVAALVFLSGVLAGLVLLLRREILAQRRIFENVHNRQSGGAVLTCRNLSPRHVARVFALLIVVSTVLAVLIAVTPSSGT